MNIIQSIDSLIIEERLQEYEGELPEIVAKEIPREGLQSQSSADDSTIGSESANAILRQLLEAFDKSTDIPRNRAEDSHKASGVDSLVSKKTITFLHDNDDIKQSNNDLTTDNTISKYEEDIPKVVTGKAPRGGVQGQSAAYGHILPSIVSELALYQAIYSSDSAKGNAFYRQLLVALDESTEDSQSTHPPLLQSKVEQQEATFTEINGKASAA